MRRHADGPGEIAPARPAGNLGFVVGEIKQAAAAEACVFARLGGEALPEVEALRGDRQFARIAVLLAAPAPIAARLFRTDPALLDQHGLQPPLRQVIGREHADNAAANHDDIGGLGQVGGGVDEGKRRGHGNLQFLTHTKRWFHAWETGVPVATAEYARGRPRIEIFCAVSVFRP